MWVLHWELLPITLTLNPWPYFSELAASWDTWGHGAAGHKWGPTRACQLLYFYPLASSILRLHSILHHECWPHPHKCFILPDAPRLQPHLCWHLNCAGAQEEAGMVPLGWHACHLVRAHRCRIVWLHTGLYHFLYHNWQFCREKSVMMFDTDDVQTFK